MIIYTKTGQRTLAAKYLPLLVDEDFPGREFEQDLRSDASFTFKNPQWPWKMHP